MPGPHKGPIAGGMSHIAPTLSAPGFTGFPSMNSPQTAYGNGMDRPSPYGDLSLDILLGPSLIQPRLTTGRVLRASQAIPNSDVFNYSKRREAPGSFPQSTPSSQSGFASNAETATFPNATPFPVMIGMLEAQITAMKQEEAERKAAVGSLGSQPNAAEIKERMKSPAELYFEAERAKVDQRVLTRLQAAGYTDEEIAGFVLQRRLAGMAGAANREEPEDGVRDVLAGLEARLPATGSNAVGIGPLSAARERADGPAQSTKQALKARASAVGTGGSVAALKLGSTDPRSSASAAAIRETPGVGTSVLEMLTGVPSAGAGGGTGDGSGFIQATSRNQRRKAAKAAKGDGAPASSLDIRRFLEE